MFNSVLAINYKTIVLDKGVNGMFLLQCAHITFVSWGRLCYQMFSKSTRSGARLGCWLLCLVLCLPPLHPSGVQVNDWMQNSS